MKLRLRCKNGHTGLITLPFDGSSFTQSGGEISHKDPCPYCGEKLTAPSGHYEKSVDDILELFDLDPKKLN
ncbi:hypothetical protein JOE51_004131 [Bradyrhizobium japonicum]|nr:hypothetical protein [Bradyrhizobium japonicum]